MCACACLRMGGLDAFADGHDLNSTKSKEFFVMSDKVIKKENHQGWAYCFDAWVTIPSYYS